jgi:hypothetical protein
MKRPRRGAKTNLPYKSQGRLRRLTTQSSPPIQNRHKEKTNSHPQKKEVDGEQHPNQIRNTNRMTAFIILALTLITAGPIGIAIACWQKDGYENLLASFFWGIGSYILVGAVLGFAYYSYVVLPAKSRTGSPLLEVTTAKIYRGQPLDQVEPDPPQRRAKIIAENAELLAGDVPVFEVTITNTGDRIAKQVKGFVNLTLADMIGENPTYVGMRVSPLQSVTDLAKGEDMIYSAAHNIILSEEDLKAIRAARKYLMAYGVISYLDGNKERQTKFCFMYSPVTFHLGRCPAHNSYQ